ncbi:hypothetical protein [Nocardioides mangrovi]|uniref:DUF4476 domain-containing protein n=1 Tax=Nocardioides mangrovi TaxID=2874580 RepID=A0ABS7U6G1_9ACTN|nr:hypothetical protein [Nocardioides mangrovi]MBZ5736569.1 hypothetical protein [Nocardioides mangrovi]
MRCTSMAMVLGAMAAVAILWLMLGLLARPASNDRRARDVPSSPVHLPRQRATSPRSVVTRASRATLAPVAAPVAGDLVALLRDEVSASEAERVLALAASHRLPDELLTRWADRFGVQRMILAVDSGVAERAMRRHLADRTQPDWAALKVFADLARVKERIAAADSR